MAQEGGSYAPLVIGRVRPPNELELTRGLVVTTSLVDDRTIQITRSDSKQPHLLRVEKAFGSETSQEEFYASVAHFADELLNRYNCTLFAYGETGSGKTHTMEHVMRRLLADLLHTLQTSGRYGEYSIKMSFFEIYNNNITDLLASEQTKLKIVNFAVDGLREMEIKSVLDADLVLERGISNRTVASLAKNNRSSRSHAFLTFRLTTVEASTNHGISAMMNLVDLAGSERTGQHQKEAHMGGDLRDREEDKRRMGEANEINSSLTALGTVIKAVAERRRPAFREKKLTHLLQPSFQGRCRLGVIFCLSACANQDAVSSLQFAENVMRLPRMDVKRNPVVMNVGQMKKHISNLLAENTAMQREKKDIESEHARTMEENRMLRIQLEEQIRKNEAILAANKFERTRLEQERDALKADKERLEGELAALLDATGADPAQVEKLRAMIKDVALREQAAEEKLAGIDNSNLTSHRVLAANHQAVALLPQISEATLTRQTSSKDSVIEATQEDKDALDTLLLGVPWSVPQLVDLCSLKKGVRHEFRRKGGFQRLASHLRPTDAHRVVVCHALADLADHGRARKALAETGAMSAVADMLRTPSAAANDAIHIAACRLINTLCRKDEVNKCFFEGHALESLTAIMKVTANQNLQAEAAQALAEIAEDNPAAKQRIVEGEVINSLEQYLYSANEQVVVAAASCLGRLASNDVAVQTSLRTRGCLNSLHVHLGSESRVIKRTATQALLNAVVDNAENVAHVEHLTESEGARDALHLSLLEGLAYVCGKPTSKAVADGEELKGSEAFPYFGRTLKGAWTPSTSGGRLYTPNYHTNPQYYVRVFKPTRLAVALHKGPETQVDKAFVGLHIFDGDEDERALVNFDRIRAQSRHLHPECASVSLTLEPRALPYVVVPFHTCPGRPAAYTLAVFADAEVEIEEMEGGEGWVHHAFNGHWMARDTVVGGDEFAWGTAPFYCNPQLRLACAFSEPCRAVSSLHWSDENYVKDRSTAPGPLRLTTARALEQRGDRRYIGGGGDSETVSSGSRYPTNMTSDLYAWQAADLEPASPLVLIPSTLPSVSSHFILNVFTTSGARTEPVGPLHEWVTTELYEGRWSAGADAGAGSSDNPALVVTTRVPARCTVVLRDVERTRESVEIHGGIQVYQISGTTTTTPVSLGAFVVESGFHPTLAQVHFDIPRDGACLVILATSAEGQHKAFTAAVYADQDIAVKCQGELQLRMHALSSPMILAPVTSVSTSPASTPSQRSASQTPPSASNQSISGPPMVTVSPGSPSTTYDVLRIPSTSSTHPKRSSSSVSSTSDRSGKPASSEGATRASSRSSMNNENVPPSNVGSHGGDSSSTSSSRERPASSIAGTQGGSSGSRVMGVRSSPGVGSDQTSTSPSDGRSVHPEASDLASRGSWSRLSQHPPVGPDIGSDVDGGRASPPEPPRSVSALGGPGPAPHPLSERPHSENPEEPEPVTPRTSVCGPAGVASEDGAGVGGGTPLRRRTLSDISNNPDAANPLRSPLSVNRSVLSNTDNTPRKAEMREIINKLEHENSQLKLALEARASPPLTRQTSRTCTIL